MFKVLNLRECEYCRFAVNLNGYIFQGFHINLWSFDIYIYIYELNQYFDICVIFQLYLAKEAS